MYRGKRIIALVPAYNEEAKIGRVVERTDPDLVDTLLVIDDGSTDRTADVAREKGADVLSLDKMRGVGAALRMGIA
ncbi:MAG: glycosyltransferase, partial [Phycisphaerae bacterium]